MKRKFEKKQSKKIFKFQGPLHILISIIADSKLYSFFNRIVTAIKRRLNKNSAFLENGSVNKSSNLGDGLVVINNDFNEFDGKDKNIKIAVHIHMVCIETLEQIIDNINKIPYDFDCFVSTDTKQKAEFIQQSLNKNCNCKEVKVQIFKNRYTDSEPFILQMRDSIDEYDYICHIHSYQSLKKEHTNDFRQYILRHLFGSEQYLKKLFYLFENDKNLGIIFPEIFSPLENKAEKDSTFTNCAALFNRLGISGSLNTSAFPMGNMFWARTQAIRQMFKVVHKNDFPKENRFQKVTIDNLIERSWVHLAYENSFGFCKVFNNVLTERELTPKKRIAFYAHYNKDGVISNTDLDSLKQYCQIFDSIIFISNSPLCDEQKEKISELCEKIILRQNKGFDFSAWQEGLTQFGYENLVEYDQLALINNSTFAPIFSMKNVFAKMQEINVDFWGLTLFPEISDGKYLNTSKITEHIQSYFVVFESKIINSNDLKEFFDSLSQSQSLTDAIKNGEVALTKFMAKKGYTYAPYISETYYIWDYLGDHRIPYDKPLSLALLGCPLVKKKVYSYISGDQKIKLESFIKKLQRDNVLDT